MIDKEFITEFFMGLPKGLTKKVASNFGAIDDSRRRETRVSPQR